MAGNTPPYSSLSVPLADGEGRAGGVVAGVARGPVGLEDDHEAVAGRLVHVAVVGLDDLEETGEIELDELVQLLGLELLGQLRVASDVQEEHRDIDGLLLELGGVRILLQKPLHRVGDELRQLALELLE